jgi:hypothetical protein
LRFLERLGVIDVFAFLPTSDELAIDDGNGGQWNLIGF